MRDDNPAVVIPAKAGTHFDLPHVNAETAESEWIPAFAGLRRQDAEANIRIVDGPEGARMTSRVMTTSYFLAR